MRARKFLVALSGLEPEFPTWKAGELNQLFDSAEIFMDTYRIRTDALWVQTKDTSTILMAQNF